MVIVSIAGIPWGEEFTSFAQAFDSVFVAYKDGTLPLPNGKETQIAFGDVEETL